jgi:hypothetical protein
MMGGPSQDFRREIDALWSALGLPAPVYGSESQIILAIDGLEIALEEGDDGRHLLVIGQGGTLATGDVEASRQIERILETSLASLTANPTCVTLGGPGAEKRNVECIARHAYGRNATHRLISAIEGVMATTEFWRRELRPSAAPTRAAREEQLAFDTALIFRP